MITICRAEDGQVHPVNASVRDIEAIGSLELFLHQEIGIDEDAAVAYLSDGRRLTNDNIRLLGSAQDGLIFVFNKYYLDVDMEEVLKLLHVEPVFQPLIDDLTATTPPIRHAHLATSYARNAHLHHEHVQHCLQSLSFQHQAIQIASKNLDINVLAITETFEGVAANAQRELEKQNSLLSGVDADLDLIARVPVHVEFLSENMRVGIQSGEPHRMLGHYVSTQKMQAVIDTCIKAHEELKRRFSEAELTAARLKEGADHIRASISNIVLLDDAQTYSRRSQEMLDRITDAAAALETPAPDIDMLLHELKQLDNAHRQELQLIINKKNTYTHQCLTALRHITTVNAELTPFPAILSALQASFRQKSNFSHIQRLHNMLYAYCATIIEIVRRKEFSRFFFQRAQSVLDVMSKVSSSERKRRQVYRGEVFGQLPFETKGMDDPVPTMDLTSSGATEDIYPFERSDVDNLLQMMDELENYAQSRSATDPVLLQSTRECRVALDKLINKMDNLEAGFDKIAERSLLSQSRISQSRRRATEAEESAVHELAEQLHVVQEAKFLQERAFQEERTAMHAEIRRLKNESLEADSSLSLEQERSARLEHELNHVQTQMAAESTARKRLEERNQALSEDMTKTRKDIATALSDATEQAKTAEALRQELSQVKAEFEEVKQLEQRHADKVAHLLDEQANSLRKLEEARSRGEDLELQIQAARAEGEEVHQALKEASSEKDRLLKAQASEHDKIIRDHIAEADGDRAILDRRLSELQARVDDYKRETKDLRSDMEISKSDAVGLREELQRVERELKEARHVERLLRDDLRAGRASQHDFEQKIEDSRRLIAQILDVAINFRNSHVKALHAAQFMGTHPTRHASNLAESTFSASGLRHSIIPPTDEPSPIDPTDPTGALDVLREFDHDHFVETVTKTIRKWQKQCKEYRERSKGKISFRNFAKGDLALFLPTRNSVSKPWAAFNVSFPHYFLQATGHLAEQLKTREWIVARITSITECVVDQKEPSSNPYGLGDGVKYYMLEVEDWTQPSHTKRRFSSRKFSGNGEGKGALSPTSKLSPSALPPGPPEPEVEDTFLVTHPPNSHLFPVRPRSNSTPASRPSSLSRLLAQAPPAPEGVSNGVAESSPSVPEIQGVSPVLTSPPGLSPSQQGSVSQAGGSAPQTATVQAPIQPPSLPSPLRPGSRASRLSTTSRFSVGRIPLGPVVAAGQPKAAATTALSDQALAESPSISDGNNPFGSPITPSPQESISDAMTSAMQAATNHRRRTTSYHTPRASALATASSQNTITPASRPSMTATNTLASLASSWGMSFGRKKKAELGVGVLTPPAESPADATGEAGGGGGGTLANATELLKRF